MIVFLATRSVLRHRTRTLLSLLGLGVAGALLLDMTMLSGGLEASVLLVLQRMGYELRVVPKGTLPFSTDAVIADGAAITDDLRRDPRVASVQPVLGRSAQVETGGAVVTALAMGLDHGDPLLYHIDDGADVERGIVLNRALAARLGLRPGSRATLSATASPQLNAMLQTRTVRVAGVATFRFDPIGQYTLALPLGTLQRLAGLRPERLSLILVDLRDGGAGAAVAREVASRHPGVDVLSIEQAMARVSEQLTYFTQFSLVLGVISLVVAFLLVATIVTLSVGERLGEIAAMRAMGISRTHVLGAIVVEGLLLAALSVPLAVGLGLLIAGRLDAILRSAPTITPELHFFVARPEAFARTVGLVLAVGGLGAAYPAHLAVRQPVAETLHQEMA